MMFDNFIVWSRIDFYYFYMSIADKIITMQVIKVTVFYTLHCFFQ